MKNEELEEELQETSEVFNTIENKIFRITSSLVNDGSLTDEQAGEINSLANEGKHEKAIELLEEKDLETEDSINFSDEEKDLFAEAFGESLGNLIDEVEEMKETLDSLKGGVSRRDMKSYLRGQKSSRTKKKVDQLFDAIDSFESGSNSNKKLARILCSFNSNLKIKETEKMLSEMRAKVE